MHARNSDVHRRQGWSREGAAVLAAVLLAACSSSNGQGAAGSAPVANPGAAQHGTVGTLVSLDGSGSSDAEGDPLTFYWGITSRPAGSTATLSSTLVARPTFTPDVAGDYVFRLLVSDGVNVSAPRYVTVSVVMGNFAPVAHAGPAQTAAVNGLVTLDGTASSDRNGDPLTYAWSFTSTPSGSTASLASATTAHPTFSPDLAGDYVVQLVVNDGTVDSAPVTVTISAVAGNLPPVADPRTASTTVVVGRLVALDGTSSHDANGDPLTFAWTFASLPPSSVASIAGPTTAAPTFTPDLAGDYGVQLVVNDGTANSVAATLTLSAVPNAAPVARPGPAQNVIPGTLATLDGSGSSDANGDFLTYAWSMIVPAGSAATLAGGTTAHPSFTPDLAGSVASSYAVQLVVNDGFVDGAPSTATITTTGFTPTWDTFAPYVAATTAPGVSSDFIATPSGPVTLPPVKFFSGGTSNGRLRLYQLDATTWAVNYNGNSLATASPYADGSVIASFPGVLARYVSMPYSPVAVPVTVTAVFANASTSCVAGQILLVKGDGTVVKAQSGCGTAQQVVSASFTDATNSEVYVLYTRVTDSGGGIRLYGLTVTTP